MLRQLLKHAAHGCGLEVRRRSVLPYGMDSAYDLQRLSADEPLKTIFDVGANVGNESRKYSRSFPQATIDAFEPAPESFAVLRDAAIPRVRPHHLALSDAPGRAELAIVSGTSGQNSLNHPAQGQPTAEVAVSTVDDFCRDAQIAEIDLLKIDVEGFETNVLRGAAGMLAAGHVRYVLAEIEFARVTLEPHSNFDAVRSLLGSVGFRPALIYCDAASNQGMLWGNALFVRC